MRRSYRYLHFDVFTDRPFGGNQLAVLPDARGLDDDTMQAIAKEMNFAETTFVFPAERPDTGARMRIFTPGAELPMAGHPTIGSTFALARAGLIPPSADRFVFGLNVGPITVSLGWEGSALDFVWMTQLPPTFGEPIDDVRGAAAMLSVRERAIGGTGLPIQVVSCGLPCLLVPMVARRDVDDAVLDSAAYSTFMRARRDAPRCVFFFSTEPGPGGATAYSRMFAPDLGISEDPATGGASGPLGCYLVAHKAVTTEQAAAMVSLQGVKMGRPSTVHVSIGFDDGADAGSAGSQKISSVRVGGQSVFVGEGFLYV
jgi:trans-2,3-dihydro-3-hydroxyanthranilate isomerase